MTPASDPLPPLIDGLEDFLRHNGQPVRLAGRYRSVPAPLRGVRRPDAVADHAMLLLQDGAKVYVEALGSGRARRPDEERAQFEGRDVVMTGIAHATMPMAGSRLDSPCLSNVRQVAERP
jgi:hypothetical protein